MTATARLAEYLTTRRERLQPEDVGLVAGASRRRVPGLRREEVAILAGISTDYYPEPRSRHQLTGASTALGTPARP